MRIAMKFIEKINQEFESYSYKIKKKIKLTKTCGYELIGFRVQNRHL